MANLFIFSNFAASTLAGPLSTTSSAAIVASGTGAEFPQPSTQQQFAAVLNDAATGLLYEVIYVTAVSGDNFTILRGQEGTVALNWLSGDLIANVVTAGQMAAMVQQVSISPIRIVTASGAFTITTADANGHIGLQRTSGLGPSSTTLPSNATPGQDYTIEDLAGNAFQYPITVNAPAGQSIAGLAEFVMNTDRQSKIFTFYGNNVWSVS